TTIAGDGTSGYSGDNGPATQAQLTDPWGIGVDNGGNLYISDYGAYVIRKVDGATGIIRTLSGRGGGCSGQTDSLGDNCAASLAAFHGNYGLFAHGSGNLYLADGNDNLVREISTTTVPLTFPQTNP